LNSWTQWNPTTISRATSQWPKESKEQEELNPRLCMIRSMELISGKLTSVSMTDFARLNHFKEDSRILMLKLSSPEEQDGKAMREPGLISLRPRRRKEVLETATHLLIGLLRTLLLTFQNIRSPIIHFTLRGIHPSETRRIPSQFQKMDQ